MVTFDADCTLPTLVAMRRTMIDKIFAMVAKWGWELPGIARNALSALQLVEIRPVWPQQGTTAYGDCFWTEEIDQLTN